MANFSLKQKLVGLCLFFCLIAGMISIVSNQGIQKVESGFLEVVKGDLPSMNTINNMYLSYQKIRINLRSLGLSNLSKTQADEFVTKVKSAISEFEDHKSNYLKIEKSQKTEVMRSEMEKQWAVFKNVGVQALGIYGLGYPISSDSLAKLNQIFLVDCPAAAEGFDKAISNLKSYHLEKADSSSNLAVETGKSTNSLILLVSVLGVIAGLGIGFFFSQKISKLMFELSLNLEKQSQNVVNVVRDLTSASQSLSAASTEQAAALQETASAVEEITSMVHKSSESAKESSSATETSRLKAEKGQQVINQMIASISEINKGNDVIAKEVEHSNQRIAELVQVIQEIGSRTKVINDIVFQTKLLSFNASVEAARAGEHGKGFAVVAEEVGNLAQMSGNAAKEISTMLDESVKKVEVVVSETKDRISQLMSEAKDTVSRGSQIAEECGSVFGEIYSDSGKVSTMVAGIADASVEQSRGVAEISKAIHELNQSTQMNASSASQCATSADQLSEESKMLSLAASTLSAIVTGKESSERESRVDDSSSIEKKIARKMSKSSNNISQFKNKTVKVADPDRLPDPSEFDEVG